MNEKTNGSRYPGFRSLSANLSFTLRLFVWKQHPAFRVIDVRLMRQYRKQTEFLPHYDVAYVIVNGDLGLAKVRFPSVGQVSVLRFAGLYFIYKR